VVAVVVYVSASGYSAKAVVDIHARSTHHPSFYSYYCPFSSRFLVTLFTNFLIEPSSLARTLGLWVRIPLKPWIFVCVYSVFVLSSVGSGLATG
jgi:hypothetical protein